MSQLPGVLRTSANYFKEMVESSAHMGLSLLIICFPMLIFLGMVGGEPLMYGLFCFAGLVFYFTIHHIEGETSHVGEKFDSAVLQRVAAVTIFIYYNALLLFTTILSSGMAIEWSASVGILIAAVYPLYDAEMAKIRFPISIAGAFVFTISVFAGIAVAIEKAVGVDLWRDSLETIQELKNSSSAAADTLASGFQNVENRLRPI